MLNKAGAREHMGVADREGAWWDGIPRTYLVGTLLCTGAFMIVFPQPWNPPTPQPTPDNPSLNPLPTRHLLLTYVKLGAIPARRIRWCRRGRAVSRAYIPLPLLSLLHTTALFPQAIPHCHATPHPTPSLIIRRVKVPRVQALAGAVGRVRPPAGWLLPSPARRWVHRIPLRRARDCAKLQLSRCSAVLVDDGANTRAKVRRGSCNIRIVNVESH